MVATVSAARRALAAVAVLKEIQGKAATAEQRRALERYSGWGASATMFGSRLTGHWAAAADELDDLLDETTVRELARLVDTSFYTPAPLIGHIYALLQSAGFTGGQILDCLPTPM